jgi:Formyl transferase
VQRARYAAWNSAQRNAGSPPSQTAGATAWSVYHEKSVTGFTFHGMNERIDDGPILLQGAVPVEPNATVLEMEWRKTAQAAEQPSRPASSAHTSVASSGWSRTRRCGCTSCWTLGNVTLP